MLACAERGGLLVGNVEYVERQDKEGGPAANKWANAWRRRRAAAAKPVLPLLAKAEERQQGGGSSPASQ